MANTIADKLNLLLDTKENIRQAINDKNVTVDISTPFDEYPSKIAEISGGGSEGDPKDAAGYRTKYRNPNWPSVQLPSQMPYTVTVNNHSLENGDQICLLFTTENGICCPSFILNWSTTYYGAIEYYNNTTLMSTEAIPYNRINKNSITYFNFNSSNTYNYILIRIISPGFLKFSLSQKQQYTDADNVTHEITADNSLLEVSCRTKRCELYLANDTFAYTTYQSLEYFSFTNIANSGFQSAFTRRYFPKLKAIVELNFSNALTATYLMFEACAAKRYPLFNTSNVEDMDNMFYNSSVEYVPLYDTSSVTTMSLMFRNCSLLKEIPLFDTSNVTRMTQLFYGCSSLKEIPLLDTSNVESMTGMFSSCSSLEEIPLLDTSKVTTMDSMFHSCSSLRKIPLLDTSRVTTMDTMFYSCGSLLTIPSLNTSNVTNMESMFYGCSNLISVPNLNTSNVTKMNEMLYSCAMLQKVGSITSVSATDDTSSMFARCPRMTENNFVFYKSNSGVQASTLYTKAALINILNNLPTVSSSDPQTLTISQTNIDKLTWAEQSIAYNKNWLLA